MLNQILTLFVIVGFFGCQPGTESSLRETSAKSDTHSSISDADVAIALQAAAKKNKDKEQDTLVVIGNGKAQSPRVKFVCDKGGTCDIPKKLFDEDVDGVPETDWEVGGWLVTDLLGTKIQDIDNAKSIRLLSRKTKIVVIVKFQKKSFPLNATVENPEGGSLQMEKDQPCTDRSCQAARVPFDNLGDLVAIPVQDWEVESWTIQDGIAAALAMPDLKKIIVKQTKNGLKIKVKFRRKRAVTTTVQPSDSRNVGPALVVANQQTICTARDLDKIRANPSGNFRLICDVDIGGSEWQSIPTFSGTLDGAGYSIQNMTITQAQSGAIGFFKVIAKTAKIVNLSLDNVVIDLTNATTYTIGALAGFVDGSNVEISYVNVYGRIHANYPEGVYAAYSAQQTFAVGGLVGRVDQSDINYHGIVNHLFTHNRVKAVIEIDYPAFPSAPVFNGLYSNGLFGAVGGLFGVGAGTVDTSEFMGTVSALACVGGIVGSSWATLYNRDLYGQSSRMVVSNSKAVGIFEGNRVGGIVGVSARLDIVKSRASGQVKIIVPPEDVLTAETRATGKLLANGGKAGGLVGEATVAPGTNISESYSDADVGVFSTAALLNVAPIAAANRGAFRSSQIGGSVLGDLRIGGLIGETAWMKGQPLADKLVTIRNSFATGTLRPLLSQSYAAFAGGIIGYGYEIYNYSFPNFCTMAETKPDQFIQIQNVYFGGQMFFEWDKKTLPANFDTYPPVEPQIEPILKLKSSLEINRNCAYSKTAFSGVYWNERLVKFTSFNDRLAKGISTTAMGAQRSFDEFDFTNIWIMPPGNAYPALRNVP